MSSFSVSLDGATEIAVKVSVNNTAVDVIDATEGGVNVPWVSVGERANATPNVTVELYDGTTAYYLSADGYCWNTRAMTARQAISFDDVVVPKGWKLRVTSSAGGLDVTGIQTKRTQAK